MASEKRCRIIIAGGGIHGLALANMLEQLDIDYLLLEARGHPTPEVGAGIGLFSNSLRILDQLGIYESVAAIPQAHIGRTCLNDTDGSYIASVNDFAEHYIRRFAYPLFFFDRHYVLKALYNNLKRKDRVLVNKAVQHVDYVSGGVNVTTADGEVYDATLLVGADGIHSRVRAEMHRLADTLQPGYFGSHDDPEKLASCSYICTFGIAQNVPHLPNDGMIMVPGPNWTQLHIPGPDKKDYFFFFLRLPKKLYGSEIRKYSKEEELEIMRQYASLDVCENVVLGDVFSRVLNSTLTPLHEYVREKWFFGRTIVLGDACHKNNPLPGQGGNNAIESAAELINGLVKVRNSRPNGLDGLTDADIKVAFQYTQDARRGRANDTTNSAHIKQAITATEFAPVTWLARKFIAPVLAEEFVCNFFSIMLPGAARLQHLPMPKRRHANPFDDEVPAKPFSRRTFIVGFSVFAIIMSIFAWNSSLPWPQEAPALPWIGKTFASLTSSLVAAIPEQDLASRVHIMYFLTQLISPLLIYTIEGNRIGHRGTFMSIPFVILAASQIWGIWAIAPIYAIFQALQSHGYCTGRFVKPEIAKSLVPALVFGYVVPTIMMLIPSEGGERQAWPSVWQFGPALVPVLTVVFSFLIRTYQLTGLSASEKKVKAEVEEYARYNDVDVPDLKIAYTFAFTIQATVHFIVGAYALTHSKLCLSTIFFGISNLLSSGGGEETSLFLRHALGVFVLAIFLSSLYSIWILRARGYIVTKEAVNAGLLITLGQVVLGPGATWTGLWYWRESVFAGLNTK